MDEERRSEELSVRATLGALGLATPNLLGAAVTVRETADAMISARTDAVLLATRPLSILTERDLVTAIASGVEPTSAAHVIATPAPLMVPDTATVLQAAELMEQHAVGHLVVIDRDLHVTGIISARAIAAVLARSTGHPEWISALRIALRISA